MYLAPTLLSAAHIKPSSFMQRRDISKLYLDVDIDSDIDNVKEEEHKNTAITATLKARPVQYVFKKIHIEYH